jgi:hypothetical protein
MSRDDEFKLRMLGNRLNIRPHLGGRKMEKVGDGESRRNFEDKAKNYSFHLPAHTVQWEMFESLFFHVLFAVMLAIGTA